METAPLSLMSDIEGSRTFGDGFNGTIDDDRFYREKFFADLTGQHEQSVRRGRRADAETGTPGERVPVPTWISERAVRYQGRAIKAWMSKRTAAGQPSFDNAA